MPGRPGSPSQHAAQDNAEVRRRSWFFPASADDAAKRPNHSQVGLFGLPLSGHRARARAPSEDSRCAIETGNGL